MRRLIGRVLEYFLSYEHVVHVRGTGQNAPSFPYHKYGGDAGYDLFASARVVILPGGVVEVPSGVRFDPKERIWFEIKARSSTLRVKGLEVVDAVIDRDFRGDLMAVVHNPGTDRAYVEVGERVAQVVPHRLIPCRFVYGELSPSPRGDNGFGSTGR